MLFLMHILNLGHQNLNENTGNLKEKRKCLSIFNTSAVPLSQAFYLQLL